MSCINNQHLTNPGQDMKRQGSSGKNAEMGPKKEIQQPETPITVAMTSELLFKLEQQSSETGPALSFVKALKAVNGKLKEHYPESEELFKVLLICDNSSDSLESLIRKHELEGIITPLLVSEEHLIGKLLENNTHLYLSAPPGLKVKEALSQDVAAAIMYTPKETADVPETPLRVVFDGDETLLRVVFDGDAVLFSSESESVFSKGGLDAYLDNENKKVNEPMTNGPFKNFLEALGKLQKKFYAKDERKKCPISTYLLTARSAASDGYRALNTLKTWGLDMDQAFFLGGSPKGPPLKMICPHIFFDDQWCHVKGACEKGVLACHVP